MAAAGRTPQASYYIVQCYVSFAEHPQTPLIVRVDDDYKLSDILQHALNKYNEILKQGTGDVDKYALPSTNPMDFVMRVAKGDGTPDRAAPALNRDAPLREQGLLFPYMLVLSLDPNKDVKEMDLTDHYRAQLLTSVQKKANGAEEEEDDEPEWGGDLQEPPEDTPLDSTEAADVWKTYSAADERKRLEEVQRKRDQNVVSIELTRREMDRIHLEECTRKEKERLERLQSERRAEEERQLRILEDNHKLEMSRKMEQFTREQKQREMIEAQKAALAEEDRECRRRQEALEKERALKQQQREERERERRKDKRLEWESGRESRMNETLDYILAKLDSSIEADTVARKEMLERERVEREEYEREQFERQYVSRIEKQRRRDREVEAAARLQDSMRQREREDTLNQTRMLIKEAAQRDEDERKEEWKKKREVTKERQRRERELYQLEHNADTTLSLSMIKNISV